jgi:uncharacterized protein (TIGR00255 family)
MIYSMTGYGSAKAEAKSESISVEIKTLNSKFFDLQMRLPKEYADKETEVRLHLTEVLKRGKVNVTIETQSSEKRLSSVKINSDLFKSHYLDLKALCESVGASTDNIVQSVLAIPEVVMSDSTKSEVDQWDLVNGLLKEAAANCQEFRQQEGQTIANNLQNYINNISQSLAKVLLQDPKRVEKIKLRIRTNLRETVGKENIDENRFEQELIYYIEKIDITEEKLRLQTHLDYFTEVLKNEEAPGKKLGFVSQEIGREINTIGSKANDAEIQKNVVEMKEELEKIKEQLLNIM